MSYRRQDALFYGDVCLACHTEILPGERIAREHGRPRHRLCVRPVVNKGAWRDSENWLTEFEFRIVREAMAKQAQPAP